MNSHETAAWRFVHPACAESSAAASGAVARASERIDAYLSASLIAADLAFAFAGSVAFFALTDEDENVAPVDRAEA